jgi:ketosteroid isomerase-like protein
MVAMATLASAQTSGQDDELLHVRRSVWLAWFEGDLKTLEQLVTSETVVMSAHEGAWKHQQDVLRESREFHESGGKLVRLEFPRTEVQHFGDVAIVWSDYLLELDIAGKPKLSKGRVTEIFVRKNGQWTNPGWHTEEPD